MLALSKIRTAAAGCGLALGVWSLSGGLASAAVLNPGDGSTALTGTYSSFIANDNYITPVRLRRTPAAWVAWLSIFR